MLPSAYNVIAAPASALTSSINLAVSLATISAAFSKTASRGAVAMSGSQVWRVAQPPLGTSNEICVTNLVKKLRSVQCATATAVREIIAWII